jgi:hypothetical protein
MSCTVAHWFASLVAGLAFSASAAQAFELVSLQEHQATLTAPELLSPKTSPVAGAPWIDVVEPRMGSVITSPTGIQLVFQASASSVVRPETFKVLYGRLRLDITQRLLGAASISAQGIAVKGASLPKGSHRLLLSIEDSLGRQGQRQLDFEVN